MRKVIPVIVMSLAAALTGKASAQDIDHIVGTWQLVSASASTAEGQRDDAPYGPSPTGRMIYTREGTMTALISYSGRTVLSGPDRVAAPADERAQAFATFFAYAGRYSLSGDKVTHHVEISSVQNWVNTDLIRIVKFEGSRMTLRTPPLSVGSVIRTSELVWERAR